MIEVGFIAIGLGAGILAAALGIGGGIVYVPALVALFSFAQHEAQGTSLAVIIPTAIVAAFVHARARRIDWQLALALGAGGIIGGLLGAWSALSLDGPLLRRMFAGFLVITSLRMLKRTRRRSEKEA